MEEPENILKAFRGGCQTGQAGRNKPAQDQAYLRLTPSGCRGGSEDYLRAYGAFEYTCHVAVLRAPT